jgi:hypothetical protein
LAIAESVVVPKAYENLPGAVNNTIPFTWRTARYQQIYGAVDLGRMVGKRITGIAFRVDEREGFDGDYEGGFVFPELDITLSITPRGVNSLTTNLDSNHGLEKYLVRSGEYLVPPLEGDLEINPFDLRFDFQTHFFYTGGNLLIDFELAKVETPLPLMDAANLNDSVNRAYLDRQDNPRAGNDSLGLITQFLFVPEPTTLTLFLGLTAIPLCTRCRPR